MTWGTLALSLLLTEALELPFVLLWGVRGRRNLLVAAACNVLTNPAAVLIRYRLVIRLGWPPGAASAAVEALCYARCGENLSDPVLLSLCANGFSWSAGVLLQLIF